MTSELIRCKSIDIPAKTPDAKNRRVFSKKFAANLAESIRMEGLLQPIVVRPNPAVPGRYVLVAGEHRLYAVSVILKQDAIEAKVILDMDDTDAEMAQDAENLWRNPLTKAQHLLAIQRWHDHYAAKYPTKVGKKAGGHARGKQQARDKAERQAQGKADPEPAADGTQQGPNWPVLHDPAADPTPEPSDDAARDPEPTPEPSSFPELVGAATGETARSVKRSIQLAKAFTKEQIEVFDAMGVKQFQMEAVAKVKDPAKRNEVVNLIASGMEPAEAIARVTEAPTPQSDADLTDEEWAEKNCKDIYGRVSYKPRFLSDVALYRGTAAATGQYKAKVHKKLAATKGQRGSYGRLLYRLLNLSHPKLWLLCGKCRGTATVGGHPCETCYGDGYKTTSEG